MKILWHLFQLNTQPTQVCGDGINGTRVFDHRSTLPTVERFILKEKWKTVVEDVEDVSDSKAWS